MRVAERGVDLSSEARIAQWKQEVALQLQEVTAQLTAKRRIEQQHDDGTRETQMLSHSLQLLKSMCQSEFDRIQKDQSSLRASIVKLEGEVAVVSADIRLIAQRSDHTAREAEDALQAIRRAARSQQHDNPTRDEVEQIAQSLRSVL